MAEGASKGAQFAQLYHMKRPADAPGIVAAQRDNHKQDKVLIRKSTSQPQNTLTESASCLSVSSDWDLGCQHCCTVISMGIGSAPAQGLDQARLAQHDC